MRYTQSLLTIQLSHQSSEEPGRELSHSVCHQGSAHPMVSEYMLNKKPGSSHSVYVVGAILTILVSLSTNTQIASWPLAVTGN